MNHHYDFLITYMLTLMLKHDYYYELIVVSVSFWNGGMSGIKSFSNSLLPERIVIIVS